MTEKFGQLLNKLACSAALLRWKTTTVAQLSVYKKYTVPGSPYKGKPSRFVIITSAHIHIDQFSEFVHGALSSKFGIGL